MCVGTLCWFNELEGVSSAVTSDCESSEWSEWPDDYDYDYEGEEEEEEEETQTDEVVPCDGADTPKDQPMAVKATKDEGDGDTKRTTITIKHPQPKTQSRKIICSMTLVSSVKKGDSVIDCKDAVFMRIGHILMIGDHFYEERRITGFGSVYLDSP